jgi:hypothetical protein
MAEIEVRSSRDGGSLRLAWEGDDWWRIDLRLPRLTATAKVDPLALDGERTLSTLFRRMADDWTGWDGARDWSSVEGTLELSATHDGLGHVSLRVRLGSGLYGEDWRVEGVIWLDAGGLSQLAREGWRIRVRAAQLGTPALRQERKPLPGESESRVSPS